MDTAKKKVYLISFFIGMIFFSFTLILQYIQNIRFSRYTIDMIDQQESLLKDLRDVREVRKVKNTTRTDSLSPDLDETLTIEACLGVEEPAEDNER